MNPTCIQFAAARGRARHSVRAVLLQAGGAPGVTRPTCPPSSPGCWMLDVGCWMLDVFLAHHARLSLAYPARASPVCPPSGARKISGGELAVRSDYRNVHPVAANPGRLATRRHGDEVDVVVDTDTL